MDREALLHRLADGRAHSGEALAREFGVTRAAVWKQVAGLKGLGLDVVAVPGRGYRLDRALDLLDRDAIVQQVAAGGRVVLERLDVFMELGSTNQHLLDQPAPRPGRLRVCLAEYQSAGRGRRGRRWDAPLGSGLCLSVAWQFVETPPQLSALTLAAGVAARRVLAHCGAAVQLKWPNDLVCDGRKLGGILVELRAEAHGGCHVVVGLGLNVAMPAERLAGVSDWRLGAADLASAAGATPPPRGRLAARLIEALGLLLGDYQRAGFAPFREEWSSADYLLGKQVCAAAATGALRGVARGIGPDGTLRIEGDDGTLQHVCSGDVSVRTAP